MYFIKNKQGINVPLVMVIADFIRNKGFYLSNASGKHIDDVDSHHQLENGYVGMLMKNPKPSQKIFFGLINVPYKNIDLGNFRVLSLEKINLDVHGKDNVGLCLELSKELTDYIKDVSADSITICVDLYLKTESIQYESVYSNCPFP